MARFRVTYTIIVNDCTTKDDAIEYADFALANHDMDGINVNAEELFPETLIAGLPIEEPTDDDDSEPGVGGMPCLKAKPNEVSRILCNRPAGHDGLHESSDKRFWWK